MDRRIFNLSTPLSLSLQGALKVSLPMSFILKYKKSCPLSQNRVHHSGNRVPHSGNMVTHSWVWAMVGVMLKLLAIYDKHVDNHVDKLVGRLTIYDTFSDNQDQYPLDK